MLKARFGSIPQGMQRIIADADPATLQSWLVSAATAATLEDVGIVLGEK